MVVCEFNSEYEGEKDGKENSFCSFCSLLAGRLCGHYDRSVRPDNGDRCFYRAGAVSLRIWVLPTPYLGATSGADALVGMER